MLKKCFILLFFCQSIYSQNVRGVVLDSLNKKPIELANVFFADTYYGTFTDSKGEFELNIKDNKSDLYLSNIGYQTKKIKFLDFVNIQDSIIVFYLNPQVEELNEIIISNKKQNYSSIKSILSEREKTLYYSFQFGSENVSYIKNEFYKKGKIEAIFLDFQKVKDFTEPCKKCKVEYIISLNIKFYEFDKKNKIPGKEIYDKNIIVELQNKTYKLKIDVEKFGIDFPIDGVCVGIETVNTKYKSINTKFSLSAPSIKFTNTKSKNEIISWSRYRREGWQFNTDTNSNNRFFKTLAIDLNVKIEK